MPYFSENDLVMEHKFDNFKCRHYINGMTSVLHCHHFASLITQLAGDCSFLDANAILAESAEDAIYEVFCEYFSSHKIIGIQQRIEIVEQYFSAVGLGKMRFIFAGILSGEIELEFSHVDQGWMKKWGKNEKPVNYIGAGFICAAFSAMFDKPTRTYIATERMSIVCGDETTLFTVVAK